MFVYLRFRFRFVVKEICVTVSDVHTEHDLHAHPHRSGLMLGLCADAERRARRDSPAARRVSGSTKTVKILTWRIFQEFKHF